MISRRELIGSVSALAVLPALPRQGERASTPSRMQSMALVDLGPAKSGAGNARWAPVTGGVVNSPTLAGRVVSGRLDWRIDPASGAVEADLSCIVDSGGKFHEFAKPALAALRTASGRVSLDPFV